LEIDVKRFPSLFVSHGAPTLIIEDVPARRFLMQLGNDLGTPQAIVVVSAHDIGRKPVVRTAAQLETLHDFGGFPRELYQIEYAPPGDPALAAELARALAEAGIDHELSDNPALDHGAWVPLRLMYPEAHVPVVPLSLEASLDAARHIAIGRAIAPLRSRGVLILTSGGLTHNLSDFPGAGASAPPLPYVAPFAEWMDAALGQGDARAFADWQSAAPNARRAHPTSDHLMPLFVGFGAGGAATRGRRLHASVTHGMLAMNAYAFDSGDPAADR
jgi:4,5-DOPA dioxygenase extradiol